MRQSNAVVVGTVTVTVFPSPLPALAEAAGSAGFAAASGFVGLLPILYATRPPRATLRKRDKINSTRVFIAFQLTILSIPAITTTQTPSLLFQKTNRWLTPFRLHLAIKF